MKQQTPTPLTKEHLTWFIENEPNMHTGNLHVYEHGLSYPEEDKVLFAKHSAVRSAVEWLKEQMLIRYYQFEEMPNSIIKESHMREIDSINELVDEAFIVFVDDSHSSGEVSGVVSGTQSQPTPLDSHSQPNSEAGLQPNQLPQHGVLAGELSLSGQEKSVDALSDIKHATRKGNPYEKFDCGHMQCTECEFHCNPDDFIVRESTERVFDECFEEAINNSLSQQPDQEVENLNIPLDRGAAMRMIAKENTYDGGDSREIVAAATPECRWCDLTAYHCLDCHASHAYRQQCDCKCHKEETPNCICEWSCHNMRLQECPKYCVCSCHKEVRE